jgi:hypothetical protein
MLDYKVAEVN